MEYIFTFHSFRFRCFMSDAAKAGYKIYIPLFQIQMKRCICAMHITLSFTFHSFRFRFCPMNCVKQRITIYIPLFQIQMGSDFESSSQKRNLHSTLLDSDHVAPSSTPCPVGFTFHSFRFRYVVRDGMYDLFKNLHSTLLDSDHNSDVIHVRHVAFTFHSFRFRS